MAVTVASATQVGLGINQDLGPVITFTADATATTTSRQISAADALGVMVVVDITAITGTGPSLTVTIEGVDRASGKTFTVLASAALNATGTTVLKVYPGGVVTANLSANDHVPPIFDVRAVIAGTTPAVTATIGVHLLQ